MRVEDFNFELPIELIAQHPLKERDQSRLLVVDKHSGELEHRKFHDIVGYLKKGDVLVLNDTRVIPARLLGVKKETEGKIEFLLLNRKKLDTYECLAKPGKRAKVGARFTFGEGLLEAEVIEVLENGNRIVQFHYDGVFEEILDRLGEMPLPPYIKEKLEDKERYQTVYSRSEGSAAAPTAGLHFTEKLLKEIRETGVEIAFLTLHVGLGTFRPVKVESVENHDMHSEFYSLDAQNAEIINAARRKGGRVISVGTTSTRTLETIADADGYVKEDSGYTKIFIYPGYQFKCIDCLITNFHLPESTLIMLVSALAGKENIMNAYETAVKEKYRFFSFGDSMFIKE
ncbi:tRNA preQ1(34) S-adenosylmethionine ribosyltransferase-isomerase QueA [Proteiniclasticum sp. SCR006]|uniref:S-adenosylmethionine:tRNA ribosyltransferase-isomerase n=1 Tax=Proteiniclasticum aestuarii TaxID=2817862 RepID=A0A939KIB8_9CLOT|nr:tRNA preQ1(34) S-adenosylmethionine ribosyltransferase-isomerase QueA [Proteiniclasticum aestuarii]MBO1263791.1 tRNA preQ1(34) S-adenosylmethionine ribosyltransferase-isomerase QueA [Proteiniclasticum aestuarii]